MRPPSIATGNASLVLSDACDMWGALASSAPGPKMASFP